MIAAKKVMVFTGTRADYGLLFWLMRDIQVELELELQLLVSGTHLSPEFGFTVKHIVEDGFEIDARVEMLVSSDTGTGIAKSMALGMLGYADALERLRPDILVVLGDRFEALAVAQTAVVLRVPILHLHGGETTEGAYDELFRHAITKLSHYHGTATETYRQRVIQMGENPENVKTVGAVGLDHLVRSTIMDRETLSTSLGIDLDQGYFLVTYHPVTLAHEPVSPTVEAMLASFDTFPDHKIIFTYPNADDGGLPIIALIDACVAQNPDRAIASPSLGQARYLAAMKYATAVVGNSSSGIIEAPSFGVPTVNIGMRQNGRLAASSVLHCDATQTAITAALKDAIDFRRTKIDNPYGQGDASSKIIAMLKSATSQSIKRFVDFERNVS